MRASRVASISFVAAALVSCEALVDGGVPSYRCTPGAVTSCPDKQYCGAGGCVACEKTDPCDGFDNDCNGKIDDGPLSDYDGDTWSWCGVGKQPDCDDHDPAVHPGAMELCNGIDDNCNGVIDEGTCPGMVCAPKLGKCVTNACDPNDPKSCPNGAKCDPNALQCVLPASKMLGDACTADSECGVGQLCAGDAILAGKLGVGGFCVQTCCVSSDCPSGFVCFGPGTGGNYCVKGSAAGRSMLGSVGGGASAARASDCRSGIIGANGRCADTCCRPTDCASGSACLAGMLDGHRTLECTTPFGSGVEDSDCGSTADCAAGACVTYNVGVGYNACVTPCCGSAACGKVIYGQQTTVCYDVPDKNGDVTPLCAGPKSGNGNAPVGASCTSNDQCRSNNCYAAMYCTDVCCTDADCSGLRCRPVGNNGKSLRCVRP